MFSVMTSLPGALLEDISEEELRNDILYYKSMLAETTRKTGSPSHLTPTTLRQHLQDCESRLQRLRGKR